MTKSPDPNDDDMSSENAISEPGDVHEKMDPFEPYTTGELARVLGIPKRLARTFLNALTDDGQVRKKETKSGPVIWVREPPTNSCPDCGREFQIKFSHPMFSAAQLCPRCGARLT